MSYHFKQDGSILIVDGGKRTVIPAGHALHEKALACAALAAGNPDFIEIIPYDAPPAPSVVPDYDAELIAAIASANTVAQLKAALLGTGLGARIKAGPKA
jgi:hypothetical protein